MKQSEFQIILPGYDEIYNLQKGGYNQVIVKHPSIFHDSNHHLIPTKFFANFLTEKRMSFFDKLEFHSR